MGRPLDCYATRFIHNCLVLVACSILTLKRRCLPFYECSIEATIEARLYSNRVERACGLQALRRPRTKVLT